MEKPDAAFLSMVMTRLGDCEARMDAAERRNETEINVLQKNVFELTLVVHIATAHRPPRYLVYHDRDLPPTATLVSALESSRCTLYHHPRLQHSALTIQQNIPAPWDGDYSNYGPNGLISADESSFMNLPRASELLNGKWPSVGVQTPES